MRKLTDRKPKAKLTEKSASLRLPVNRILFNYAIAIPITRWILEGRQGPKPNLWEAYDAFLKAEGIKTEADIEACIERYGADRYLPKVSKRQRGQAKVYHLRAS